MSGDGRIRVGIYIYTPMIGGAELYCRDLLRRLDRARFDVTLFCEPWREFLDYLDLPNGPPTRLCTIRMREIGGHYGAKELRDPAAPKQLSSWERGMLKAIAVQRALRSRLLKLPGRMARAAMQVGYLAVNVVRLSAAFRRHPVDVLHVMNGGYPGAQSAQIAGFVAKLSGCPVTVMTVCNTPVARHFPKTFERLLDWFVRGYYDAIVVAGEPVARMLVELRGLNPVRIVNIPEGVAAPDEYGAVQDDEPDEERSTGTMTIAMVAGFLPHKGHRFLLEALALLRPEFPDLRATLVGDGPLMNDMRRLADQLGLSDIVTFMGFRPLPETLQIMSRSDVVAHPAIDEDMPYAILHAMSLGKPVVATTVGLIPEAVQHQGTGCLVPPGDSAALADALRQLGSDRDRRRQMGAAARARYGEQHSVDVMVGRYATVFEGLLARGAEVPGHARA